MSDEPLTDEHDRSGDVEDYSAPRKRSTDEDQSDLDDDEKLARRLPFNDYTTVERRRLKSGELRLTCINSRQNYSAG